VQIYTIPETVPTDSIFTVDCKGRSGGLNLLWKSDIGVEIQNYNRRHINAVIQSSNADFV